MPIQSSSAIYESQTGNQASQGPMLAVNSCSDNYLPSNAILQHLLKNVDQVIRENHKWYTEASAKYWQKRLFGKDVMEHQTVHKIVLH